MENAMRIIRKIIDLDNVRVTLFDIYKSKTSTIVRFKICGLCVNEFEASRPGRPKADDDYLATQRTNLIGEKAKAEAQYSQIITTEVKIMPTLHFFRPIGLAKVSGDMVTIWIDSRNEEIVTKVNTYVLDALTELVTEIAWDNNRKAEMELRQDTRPADTSTQRVIRLNRKRSFDEFRSYADGAPDGITLAELIQEARGARKAARSYGIELIKVEANCRIGPLLIKEFGELFRHVNYIQVAGALIRIVLKPSASTKDEKDLLTIARRVANDYNRAARNA
jgi:hypothetical protein